MCLFCVHYVEMFCFGECKHLYILPAYILTNLLCIYVVYLLTFIDIPFVFFMFL